jgi:hypothetical protein
MNADDFWTIECAIEQLRSEQRWEQLKPLLDQYSSIFDVTSELHTKFHSSVREMKTYYWETTAEYSFFQGLDFHSTVDSIRRALAFDVANVPVRLLVAKIILHICQPTLQSYFPHDMKLKTNLERCKIKNFHDHMQLELAPIMGESYEKVTTRL